jgi:hypothetical protein
MLYTTEESPMKDLVTIKKPLEILQESLRLTQIMQMLTLTEDVVTTVLVSWTWPLVTTVWH